MVYLIFAVVAIAVVAPLVAVALSVDDWGRDFTNNRAATNADADHPLSRPLTQRFTVEELDTALAAFCRDDPAWSMPEDAKPLPADSPLPAEGALAVRHLVRTTALMRYRDDIWVVVEPHDDEKLRAHVESRSRVGKGDLGQNPRNLVELNSALLERLVLKAPPPATGK